MVAFALPVDKFRMLLSTFRFSIALFSMEERILLVSFCAGLLPSYPQCLVAAYKSLTTNSLKLAMILSVGSFDRVNFVPLTRTSISSVVSSRSDKLTTPRAIWVSIFGVCFSLRVSNVYFSLLVAIEFDDFMVLQDKLLR